MDIEEVLRQNDPSFVEGVGELIPIGEAHQLHVGVEKLRATEILFQPGMVGIEEAGLAETLAYVLKDYSPENQVSFVKIFSSTIFQLKSLISLFSFPISDY